MSKRRYKPISSEQQAYNDKYDSLRKFSIVFNEEVRKRSKRILNFGNRKDLKNLLTECNEKQKLALQTIHTINNRHTGENEKRLSYGRAKIEMPDKFKNEIFRAEALEDVLMEEAEELIKLLDNVGVEEAERTAVLKYGCQGTGVIKSGTLVKLDGQTVAGRNGELFIKDDRSPFNGKTTIKYFQYNQTPWCKAKARIAKEKNKLESRLGKQGLNEEIDKQWAEKSKQLFKDHPEWNDLFSTKLKGCLSMPNPEIAKL